MYLEKKSTYLLKNPVVLVVFQLQVQTHDIYNIEILNTQMYIKCNPLNKPGKIPKCSHPLNCCKCCTFTKSQDGASHPANLYLSIPLTDGKLRPQT